MKWCVLIKPIGIKEPIGIYCNTGFDYFGESNEYIDHDFGVEGEIDLIIPVFFAKIIFLKNTIKANKAFKKYLTTMENI